MAVKVSLKFVRHSARKLMPVTRYVSGKNLEAALQLTAVMPSDSARTVNKALKMAASAAKQKELDSDQLIISQIFASIGPKIRRTRANARGRANRYMKHLAHLTVIVDEAKAAPVTPKSKKTKAEQSEDTAKEAK